MGKVVKAVVGVAVAVVGVVTGNPMLIAQGASMTLGAVLSKSPKGNSTTNQRLSKQLSPEDFRKIVFGRTAGATDLRFWEVHGSKNTTYSEVIAVAGHRVNSFQEFYAEEEAVGFSGTAATGTYSGVLTRRLNDGAPGNAALAVGSGTYWNANSKFTGVAHYALTWQYDEKKLPNGIPQKITQVIEGALVYDPRRDSTRGGSGSHRIDDQSTWSYATLDGNGQPIGRNNALQALWYLVGWRVQNPSSGEWVLVAGQGVDPVDIDVASFIAAANDAEAQQFYTDMILSTGDSHATNRSVISCGDTIGRFLDPGGLWTYRVTKDDTAVPAVTLTEDDVLEGSVEWVPDKPMSEQYNRVVGTYVDPSATALFQAKSYPQVKDTAYETADGFKKRKTLNFQAIQDEALAQKAARIVLNEGRYVGEFRATFGFKALQAQVWDVVGLTLERYGFDSSYRFRVRSQSLSATGIEMLIRITHASVYAGGTVTTSPAPSTLAKYDPRQQVAVEGLSATQATLSGAGGAAQDAVAISWTAAPGNVRRTEGQFKLTAAASWTTAFASQSDLNTCIAGPLLPSSSYQVRVRHVSIHEVPGPWTTVSITTGANGRVTSAQVTYADGTSIEALKPAEVGANVTETRTAAAIVGQGPSATDSRGLDSLYKNPSSLLYDGGFRLRGAGWALGAWGWMAGGNGGPYISLPVNGTQVAVSPYFQVYNNGQYTIGAELYNYGVASGNLCVDFVWWNGATLLGYSTQRISRTPGEIWTRLYVTDNAPSNATRAQVRVFTESAVQQSGSVCAVRRIKVSAGSERPPFSDDITDAALYSGGVHIDTLKPNELGANVTETRTAAAIAGQAQWATYNGVTPGTMNTRTSRLLDADGTYDDIGTIRNRRLTRLRRNDGVTDVTEGMVVTDQGTAAAIAGQAWAATNGSQAAVDNTYAPLPGVNRVRFSLFEKDGPQGWTQNYNPSGLPLTFSSASYLGVRFGKVAWTPTASGQQVNFGCAVFTSGGERYRIPVTPNERVFARLNVEALGPQTMNPVIWWMDQNGSPISGQSLTYAGSAVSFANTYQGFFTAPSNARFAYLEAQGTSTAAGTTCSLAIVQPMLCGVAPNQTTPPPFNPGPGAEWGSDVTGEQTAAAITGQGYFATQNYAFASRIQQTGFDNIIPDHDYRDSNWWGFTGQPNIGVAGKDQYWEQSRALAFTCDRDFDISSQFFAVEYGSTYRVRVRIWNNDTAAGWSGAFWPMIHMPLVAWWSLKHGYGVDPGQANAANAIVANGDTDVQEFYFRVSSTQMRQIQFRFISTARGSGVNVQVQISKVPQLGKDLMRNGLTTRYNVSEIETGLGTAGGIAGQGAFATMSQLDPRTSYFRATGSVPATIPDNSFSYTSTTSSIAISWPAMTIYRVDGTTVSVGAGSQTVTGLSSSTTYKVYPYISDGGGTSGSISFVSGGAGSPGIMYGANGSAAAAAVMYGQGNIPMGSFLLATPASGSGGGGGGGSGWCLHPETELWVDGELRAAGTVAPGHALDTPDGRRAVVAVHRAVKHRWVEVETTGGHRLTVTPEHVLYSADGSHVHAGRLALGALLRTDGDLVEVVGLRLIDGAASMVAVELDEPHLYLAGPGRLLSHNAIQKP